jgi:hypothetical protein
LRSIRPAIDPFHFLLRHFGWHLLPLLPPNDVVEFGQIDVFVVLLLGDGAEN